MLPLPSRGLAAALLLACSASHAGTGPRVVVSVAPVHALVAAVMQGVAEPELLLAAAVSPHHVALRPSQARALETAALVVWVGPPLETFLARALADGPASRRVLTLLHAAGIRRPSRRRGGVFHRDRHGGAADHGHPDPHRHTPGGADPHLWLDPGNARAVVAAVVGELMRLDPVNAERYRRNGAATAARVDALDRELAAVLAPVREIPYVVFHDAYQAFEAHYALNAVGAVSPGAERSPGARHVAELRATITATGARCVFREPQFPPRLMHTLVEGTGARTGVLDPLGVDIPPGPQAWFTLMRNLAGALAGCLSAAG